MQQLLELAGDQALVVLALGRDETDAERLREWLAARGPVETCILGVDDPLAVGKRRRLVMGLGRLSAPERTRALDDFNAARDRIRVLGLQIILFIEAAQFRDAARQTTDLRAWSSMTFRVPARPEPARRATPPRALPKQDRLAHAPLPYLWPTIVQRPIFGRERELDAMDEANARGGVLALVGWPGTGKTALARTWLRDRAEPGRPQFWWSFDEQPLGRSVFSPTDWFWHEVQAWMGRAGEALSPWQRAQALAAHLKARQGILFLDGVERLSAFGGGTGRFDINALLGAASSSGSSLIVLTLERPLDEGVAPGCSLVAVGPAAFSETGERAPSLLGAGVDSDLPALTEALADAGSAAQSVLLTIACGFGYVERDALAQLPSNADLDLDEVLASLAERGVLESPSDAPLVSVHYLTEAKIQATATPENLARAHHEWADYHAHQAATSGAAAFQRLLAASQELAHRWAGSSRDERAAAPPALSVHEELSRIGAFSTSLSSLPPGGDFAFSPALADLCATADLGLGRTALATAFVPKTPWDAWALLEWGRLEKSEELSVSIMTTARRPAGSWADYTASLFGQSVAVWLAHGPGTIDPYWGSPEYGSWRARLQRSLQPEVRRAQLMAARLALEHVEREVETAASSVPGHEVLLAIPRLAAGDALGAKSALDAGLPAIRRRGHLVDVALAVLIEAQVARAVGDSDAAALALDEVEAIARFAALRLILVDALLERARLIADEDRERALDLVYEAQRHIEDTGYGLRRPEAQALREALGGG
ncbi:MAG: ATP-binding protein [Myxococcota bacterium]